MTTPKDRTQVSVRIKKDLAARLDREADARMVGKSLLVEKALEGYLDALPTLDVTPRPPQSVPGT